MYGSQVNCEGSHPEARGHGFSIRRRASRGLREVSSLGKIPGLTEQITWLQTRHGNRDTSPDLAFLDINVSLCYQVLFLVGAN